MCAVILGPVEDVGHPFDRQKHEVPRRRVIGDTIVYSFGRPFLYEPVEIEPEEGIDAVAIWDPCWLRLDEDQRGEWDRIEDLAVQFRAPIVGILGDWFSGWRSPYTAPQYSIPNLLPKMQAVITDVAGAATIASHGFNGRVETLQGFLSYGRLPTLGNDPGAVANACTETQREIDVCCISYEHPSIVWQRPYYLSLVREICKRRGWSCVIRDGISVEHMEALYLRSRVVFNCSLGSQLNCRAYEALACGCSLLTDAWNLEAGTLPETVETYVRPETIEDSLERLVTQAPDATLNVPWLLQHGPQETWKRTLAAILTAATPAGYSRPQKAAGSDTSASKR